MGVFNKINMSLNSPSIVQTSGRREWYLNGRLHRDGDLPAVVWPDPDPAKIIYDAAKEWWVHGKLHRAHDKPARLWPSGSCEWWVDNKQHRDNDKPAAVYSYGMHVWCKHGVTTQQTYVTNFKENSCRFYFLQFVVLSRNVL